MDSVHTHTHGGFIRDVALKYVSLKSLHAHQMMVDAEDTEIKEERWSF